MKKNTKYLIAGAVILLIMSGTNVYNSLYSLLKKLEEDNKVQLKAYLDSGGVWTIGYGSIYNYDLNRPVQQNDIITTDTANKWLQLEASTKLDAVKNLVKVKVNNNQLIAMSSLAYNIGTNGFANSTLLKLLNAGTDKAIVAQQFDKWVYDNGVKVKGLQNRRQAEKNLFLS